jgi:hypothetical protein
MDAATYKRNSHANAAQALAARARIAWGDVRLRNRTPHPLSLHGADGTVLSLPVDGPAPRLGVERQALGLIAGLPIVRSTMGAVGGLPEEREDIIVIVSALVAEACPERGDLAYPGEAIRDEAGRIIGARGLCAGPGLARRLS